MDTIKKQYIVDENSHKIGVQIDIQTFHKIEEVLENYALAQLINDGENSPPLSLRDAQAYYAQLEKAE